MKSFDDYWLKLKILLHLPFPLRNHYYKWRRYNVLKAFFCTSCNQFFDITKMGNILMSELKCPRCGSKSYYGGGYLFKAWVDKKSLDDVLKIVDRYKRLDAAMSELEKNGSEENRKAYMKIFREKVE